MHQYPIKNKLDILLQKILVDRAVVRFESGEYYRAGALLKAILIDFPENRQAKARLVDVYLKITGRLIKENDFEKARQVFEKALVLDRRGKNFKDFNQALEKSKIESPPNALQVRIRETARRFIEKFYSEQLDWFDAAWRIFKDVTPDQFESQYLQSTLGITSAEEADLIVVEVVVILSAIGLELHERLTEEKIVERIRWAGSRLKVSEFLVNQLTRHALESFQSFLP